MHSRRLCCRPPRVTTPRDRRLRINAHHHQFRHHIEVSEIAMGYHLVNLGLQRKRLHTRAYLARGVAEGPSPRPTGSPCSTTLPRPARPPRTRTATAPFSGRRAPARAPQLRPPASRSGSRTRTRYAPTGPPTASRPACPCTPSPPDWGTLICGPPPATPPPDPSRSTVHRRRARPPPPSRPPRYWRRQEMRRAHANSEMTTRATLPGSTQPQEEIFQFDAIIDVRVRQTSLAVAPSRPAREVQ